MSFPRYPKYKDSGVEWLGVVPEHWNVLPLKRCARLVTGMTPPTDQEENYSEEPYYPWIRPEDLNESGGLTIGSKFLSRKGWDLARKIPPYTSLICCIGTIGKVGYIAEDATTNQQLTGVVFARSQRYFYYALCAARSEFEMAATGNVVRILNTDRLGRVDFPLPPELEATAISSFLDRETTKIDALVAEQQRLLELLKEKRQAVISHAVTKGLNPAAPMKPSGIDWLGDVPAHWTRSQPKNVTTKIVDGVHFKPNYVDEGVPFVTVQNLTATRGISFENLNYISDEDHDEYYKRANPEKGDVLITKDGTLGVVRVIETDRVFSIFVSVALLKPIKQRVAPWFLAYALESDIVYQQFKARQLGSALKHIHLVELRNVFLMLPPLKEQLEIVRELNASIGRFEKLQAEAERAIELLQERRTALISAAVTGKIDVRGLAAQEAA